VSLKQYFIAAEFGMNIRWIRYASGSSVVISNFTNIRVDIVIGYPNVILYSQPPSYEYSKDFKGFHKLALVTRLTWNAIVLKEY
jgi:hypothetical protein